MSSLLILIPAALFLGLLGLAAFLWAMRSGQFDDLEGAAHRILYDDSASVASPGLRDEETTALAKFSRKGVPKWKTR